MKMNIDIQGNLKTEIATIAIFLSSYNFHCIKKYFRNDLFFFLSKYYLNHQNVVLVCLNGLLVSGTDSPWNYVKASILSSEAESQIKMRKMK